MSKPLTLGEEETAFYYYLGRAIQAWVFVEITLREIVLVCTDDDLTKKALAVGFVSIDGFKAKADFAEGVVGRKFVAQRRELAGLAKTARALSQQRNKLAHRGLALYELNDPGRRFLLSPWKHEKPHYKGRPKRPIPPEGSLSIRDIVKLEIEFTHCAMTLRNFAYRLEGREEPHKAAHEPPVRPPTTPQLVARMREVLANPLGSYGGSL